MLTKSENYNLNYLVTELNENHDLDCSYIIDIDPLNKVSLEIDIVRMNKYRYQVNTYIIDELNSKPIQIAGFEVNNLTTIVKYLSKMEKRAKYDHYGYFRQ